MSKLCECGCGSLAPVATMTRKDKGHIAGRPIRFVPGHQNRGRKWSNEHRDKFVTAMVGRSPNEKTKAKISATHKRRGIRPSKEAAAKGNTGRPTRADNWSWKGGVSYVNRRKCLYIPEHPRAHKNGYVYESIVIAEQASGRPIDPREVVHHIDGDFSNNAPTNLLVLPSQSEHLLLHRLQGDIP